MTELKKTLKVFTLIELMAAMGVFAIIMVIVLTFFVSAQNAMSITTQRTMTYENARIALDLIARDLQCAFYENGKIPFWFKGYTNYALANAVYDQEALCFISATSLPPNDNCSSKLCEVKYQLYNFDDTILAPNNGNPALEGWLLRSVTGNTDDANSLTSNPKWNFYNKFTVGINDPNKAFTADGSSSGDPLSGDFRKVIPYVTKLEFKCYKKDGSFLDPGNDGKGDTVGNVMTGFPYEVKIDLTLMDGTTWSKWKAQGGRRYVTGGALFTDPADDYRQKNERTFSKTVLLGERGQQ